MPRMMSFLAFHFVLRSPVPLERREKSVWRRRKETCVDNLSKSNNVRHNINQFHHQQCHGCWATIETVWAQGGLMASHYIIQIGGWYYVVDARFCYCYCSLQQQHPFPCVYLLLKMCASHEDPSNVGCYAEGCGIYLICISIFHIN